jgi:ABC-type lipopolysaccharide export system ATPase subunit
MLLELADLTKYFGGLCVLSDVSFNVDKGDIVGLMGPDGARQLAPEIQFMGDIPVHIVRVWLMQFL